METRRRPSDQRSGQGALERNLSGDLETTIKVARAGHGEFPQGTVIQLVPNEAMAKQQKGFSEVTKDRKFFTSTSSTCVTA